MAFNLGDALKNVPNLGTGGKEQITYLPIDSLNSDEGNFYELRDIDKLADNISVAGLQQPVRVRASKELGRYTIVSGHRRTAAIRLLAADAPESWKEIPCIIETDSVSPAMQQLRLIYANANTRQLTSAEISEQAAQVEKLLYQLQEEGYSFPGRMRDHVAEAVGASKSKLSRLKVIRDRLIPEWTAVWQADNLPESAAYTLAQAPADRQKLLYDKISERSKDRVPSLSQNEASNVLLQMELAQKKCDSMHCFRGCTCDHVTVRQQKAANVGAYSALSCNSIGCCRDCGWLRECAQSCEYAADIKNAKIAKWREIERSNQEKKKEAKAKEKAEIRTQKNLLNESYRRVAARRTALGLSQKEVLTSWDRYVLDRDLSRFEELELGKAKATDRMPGGIWAYEAQHLISLAELLQCSVDYLLGRDVPANISAEPDGWHQGTPPAAESGNYVIAYRFGREDRISVDTAYWNGHGWIMYSMPLAKELTVVRWIKGPEL